MFRVVSVLVIWGALWVWFPTAFWIALAAFGLLTVVLMVRVSRIVRGAQDTVDWWGDFSE